MSKDEIKDFIILYLIENLCQNYAYNFNLDSKKIKKMIMKKIKKMNIINKYNFNLSEINSFKNQLENCIKDIIPENKKNNFIQSFSIQKKHKFGSGGFSNVYKCFNPLDAQFYAIKKIGINEKTLDKLSEVRILSKLNNPNIVRNHTCWFQSEHFDKKILVKDKIQNKISEDYGDYDSKM